jgi:hypothetical protein
MTKHMFLQNELASLSGRRSTYGAKIASKPADFHPNTPKSRPKLVRPHPQFAAPPHVGRTMDPAYVILAAPRRARQRVA